MKVYRALSQETLGGPDVQEAMSRLDSDLLDITMVGSVNLNSAKKNSINLGTKCNYCHCPQISYFFCYKMEFFFSFQNNPKNLDPSYKKDQGLWELFRKG